MLALSLIAAHAALCPSPDLEGAMSMLARGEPVDSVLDEVERSFTCAPVTPRELARFWLLEGALLLAEGDAEGANQSLSAARRVSPDTWDARFPDAVRDAWEQAGFQGRGSLEVTGDRKGVLVDGHPWISEDVPAGMHVVQREHRGRIVFGKVVFVPDGGVFRVEPPAPTEDETPRFRFHLALGLAVAVGRGYTLADQVQPSVRVAAPVEIGLRSGGPVLAWTAGLGLLGTVNGPWLVTDRSGEPASRTLGAEGWGGAQVGDPVSGGIQIGVQSPSRWFARLDVSAGERLRVHVRPGVQRVRGGGTVAARLEPALTALVAFGLP